jgi:hypothetical protein
VVVTAVPPWAAVTLARSLDTAACLHRTTPATRSVVTTFCVCKPVVPNARPALALALSSAPARCLAAREVVAVARVLVPPEMVKALDLHRDQALPHNKRRRRQHTSTLSGKQCSSNCTFLFKTNTICSALAALENQENEGAEGAEGADDVASPPSNAGSPPVSKATPSIDEAASTDA